MIYRIRRCPVPPLSSPPPCLVPPPVSLGKSWSLTISLKKNYIENFRIRNYFKKDFLIFLFIMFDTIIIYDFFGKNFSSVCFFSSSQ